MNPRRNKFSIWLSALQNVRRGPRLTARNSLGAKGERIAARHLRRKQYRILEKNVRTSIGEIDLICRAPDRKTIVFVEVKTRMRDADSAKEIPPECSVDRRKQRKLMQLAGQISRKRKWTELPQRIDVIAIETGPDRAHRIQHFEGAVYARRRTSR